MRRRRGARPKIEFPEGRALDVRGRTWWTEEWIREFEDSAISLDSRMARGRTYARQGRVAPPFIQPGEVLTQVQGSRPRPYEVALLFDQLRPERWEPLLEFLAADGEVRAALETRRLPTDFEDRYPRTAPAFLPRLYSHFVTTCSCPDGATPCKHGVAAFYALVDLVQDDPTWLFTLRGCDREALDGVLGDTPEDDANARERVTSPEATVLPVRSKGGYKRSPEPLEPQVLPPLDAPRGLFDRLGSPDTIREGERLLRELDMLIEDVAGGVAALEMEGEDEDAEFTDDARD